MWRHLLLSLFSFSFSSVVSRFYRTCRRESKNLQLFGCLQNYWCWEEWICCNYHLLSCKYWKRHNIFHWLRVTVIRFTCGCRAFRAYCWRPWHLEEIDFQARIYQRLTQALIQAKSHALFKRNWYVIDGLCWQMQWVELRKSMCRLSCHFKKFNVFFFSAWIRNVVNSESWKLTHYLQF